MPAAGGLLRGDRLRQPPRRAQDDQDAGRRLRRRRSNSLDAFIEANSPWSAAAATASQRRGAVASKPIGMTKRFGPFAALDDVSPQGHGRHVPCAPRRERRRQVDARQMHHGVLPRRGRRDAGRRPGADDRQSARTPMPWASAWSISISRWCPSMTVRGKSGHEPRRRARGHRLAARADGAGCLHGAHAVPGAARRARSRRSRPARKQKAEILKQLYLDTPLPHPRRADLGADAAGGRRDARPAARDGAGAAS